ncbi:hypothetical protein [Streptomyces sp. NPDC060027]|uniref:hypothetical protein n=1 Tax=Streptomyces sp. NPDC060027 TaxID=3347040 RepID=UPI0036AFA1FD
MSGDEPYAGHNPLAVLLLAAAGLGATPWLLAHGVRLLFRAGAARTAGAALAAATALTWAAAVGMYTWGVLHLVFLDESSQSQACAKAVGTRQIAAYEPSFVPLRFDCRTSDGHTFEAVVPSYLNPSVAVLGVGAAAFTCAGFARARSDEDVS